jgi:3-mercaptopyruvate sulfurtransferase SseA
MKNKEHLTVAGLNEIKLIKSGMNSNRKIFIDCNLGKRSMSTYCVMHSSMLYKVNNKVSYTTWTKNSGFISSITSSCFNESCFRLTITKSSKVRVG